MQKSFAKIIDMFRLDDEIFVQRAQLRSLTKQLPILYIACVVNALVLGRSHFHIAPWWLAMLPPLIIGPVCLLRAWQWRRMPIQTFDDATVTRLLRRTIILVAVLAIALLTWANLLLSYGNLFEQLGVFFFISNTGIGCIFCLVQLRPAALLVMAVLAGPLMVHVMALGHEVTFAIGCNLLVICASMIFVMFAYYEDFRQEVHTTEKFALLGEERRVAAETDLLTGLANRRRFFEELERDIATPDASFAVGLIDLDGFKPVNDRLGHAAGDIVLAETARRLQEYFSQHATIARLGGDEFGLIVRGPALDDLEGLGARMARTIARPIQIAKESTTATVAASLGFALFPTMGRTPEKLMERADFALYHAKNNCRGTAVVFDDDHASTVSERRAVEEELGRADLEAELFVVFQPIVDGTSGRTVAFEALARWTSPRLGIIPPNVFIPLAERLGLVRRLTDILFLKACRGAASWPPDIRLSFNLSVHDLFGGEALERLTRLLGESGIDNGQIIFEITEGVMMRDFAAGSTILQALRDLGCEIALDDFGTGFSSLSYVHRLPLDRLKIDQSFVRSMTSDRTSRAIVQSILGLSSTLGVQCVVEGVETEAERSILEGMGVRWMQGYHFGRPMTEDAALLHLAGNAIGSLTSLLAELDQRDGVANAA